jgi:hypothetical protein
MSALNIPISGPQICRAGLEFGEKFNLPEFKASNGWLEKFLDFNDIKNKILSGESKSADLVSASEFIHTFAEKSKFYRSKDIFNVDETALYYKATPNSSYVTSSDLCSGTKIIKKRVTVLLGVSMEGEKIKPLVIGDLKSQDVLAK